MAPTRTHATLDERRLRWRCRRGMRELDMLLDRYLREQYAGSPPGERAAFARLLELPDAELLSLLLGQRVTEDARLADIIGTIRNTAQF